MSQPIEERLRSLVQSHRILLFMKGNRTMPMCGFSAAVVQALDQAGARYETVDVLEDSEIREGIKRYSNWPTIPQLYVNGQFVGGCDIVREMHSRGELGPLLRSAASPDSR